MKTKKTSSKKNFDLLKLKKIKGAELQKIVGGKKDFIIIIDIID